MDTIYYESRVRDHVRVRRILERYPKATLVECDRYTEVFNVNAQDFRVQKRRPALILAEKHGSTVLPTPPDYSIGRKENHYFSHMLNCLYDCRYCFLQGMYRSANYVHFVNFEDFEKGIDEVRASASEPPCFFSGYDCDSLAMESLTGFAEHFLPFFGARPDSWMELRTKSLQTDLLQTREAIPNVVPAFTLTPDPIAREVEHGAPPYAKRLKRLGELTQRGWNVGLRLDPLIPWPRFAELYTGMIREVFERLDSRQVHSVTLGPMRFPKAMYERILRLYPDEKLFVLEEMELREGQMTYPPEIEEELTLLVTNELLQHLPPERVFRQV